MLGIAIWTITDRYQYVALLSTLTYPTLTYFLLVAGGLVFLVAVLGCCAVCKNHRPLIILVSCTQFHSHAHYLCVLDIVHKDCGKDCHTLCCE